MTWLVSDWDHRDPSNDLEDVETGKCLDAIDSVGGNLRMLLESSDFHPIIEEDKEGHYHIVKLIRKRNPEFKEGKYAHFVYDKEGTRISLTEDQFDSLLGINHNPEDLFETEGLDLQTLDTNYIVPKDDWDVVWDETDVRRAHKNLQQMGFWDSLSSADQDKELQMLRDGIHPEYPDVQEYSAKFFQYSSDKRLSSPKAKMIANQIKETGLARWQIGRLLANPPKIDLRPEKAQALKAKALTMPLGKERARLMNQASAMMECYTKTVKAMRKRGKHYSAGEPGVSSSDKKALWSLWRDQEISKTGKVELNRWQYERALYAKLVRIGVEPKDARVRVQAAVKKLYGVDYVGKLSACEVPGLIGPQTNTLGSDTKPEWLQNMQPVSETITEDDGWQPCDWLTDKVETNHTIPPKE